MLRFTAPLLLGALGCVHHETRPLGPQAYLAGEFRAQFADIEGDSLYLAQDGSGFWRPDSATEGYALQFRWHLIGTAIVIDPQYEEVLPERAALVAHGGGEYLVPWSADLCELLPTFDWSESTNLRPLYRRVVDPLLRIPAELDVCLSR